MKTLDEIVAQRFALQGRPIKMNENWGMFLTGCRHERQHSLVHWPPKNFIIGQQVSDGWVN